jgi:hypothetical protein
MSDTGTDTMAWFRAGEVSRAKRMCKDIFDCGIFSPGNSEHPLFEAAITQLLIGLNDLLQKAKRDGKRVALIDHVQITEGRADVTDLIRDCRNAACHISTGLHNLGTNKFTFNTISGKRPNAFRIGNLTLGCEFEDDIAAYWGESRLYLKRNALVAFQAAIEVLPDTF